MTTAVEQAGVRARYDSYRFGNGVEPELQAGTIGWSVSDLNDPVIRGLFHAGRFEIVEGVLTAVPPAFFRGGEAPQNLIFLLQNYFRVRRWRARFATEVDVQIDEHRLARSDAACVIGTDLAKFEAMTFDDAGTDWRDHALIFPPTLIIESVSQGNGRHDRQTKHRWYAEMGVPNYWIVDAFTKRLDCLRLDTGHYLDSGCGSGSDVVTVAAFEGLQIPLAEVWAD